ncbi:glycosyltransferase family 4 protein [Candidatus Pacearchaeota archaeon]|nr:glycosyltransferase family 4 protein [Candidatus Pacearchaeota archaeon]
MKIAHVSPEFYPAIGGVGQVVRELAARQVKEGNEVHVFAPAWDKEKRIPSGEEIIDGIHVHRFFYWFKAGNFGTFWPQVLPSLIKGKFNVIHSHLFAHAHFIFSAIASKLSKAKHIHTTHCPWSDAHRPIIGKILMYISYNIFSRIALNYTDKVILITPWEKEFITKYADDKNKLIVIPNGMSNIFFKKIKNNDFKIKNKIKNSIVLFFGRLNATKSPDNFVKIAKLVLKEYPDVTFIIRGPDEGMKSIVKKLIGNEKRIILMAETRDRNEIIKMYQSSSIYALPSYREGLPLTLFEAMASGLPIVATPVNGVPYEVKNNENGFLVSYGDNEGFKEKIIKLLKDNKTRNAISKNNLKKAKQYDWDIINKKIMQLYG